MSLITENSSAPLVIPKCCACVACRSENVPSKTCFSSASCAVLKNVPLWIIASDWHCATFVISKPHVKCKVLKRKLCKETQSKAKLHLFVCLFFSNEVMDAGYFKCNELKRYIVVCLRYDQVCTVSIWNMFWEWHICQNGTPFQSETCFIVALVSERYATRARSYVNSGPSRSERKRKRYTYDVNLTFFKRRKIL